MKLADESISRNTQVLAALDRELKREGNATRVLPIWKGWRKWWPSSLLRRGSSAHMDKWYLSPKH